MDIKMNDLTRKKANVILSMKRTMLYNINVDKVYFTCVDNLKHKIDIDLYYMSNEPYMINNDIKTSIRNKIIKQEIRSNTIK